jgi:DNA-binding transcriptional MerR regulator
MAIGEPDNNPNMMISAKEITQIYKLTYQTVNYYTDLGLLPVVSKEGNVRYYDRETVQTRLAEIANMKKEGYSLRLIRRRLIGI